VGEIRVDIELLKEMARRLASAAERLAQPASGIETAVESAGGYDGQLAPQVQSIAGGDPSAIRALGRDLAEKAERLARIAQAFAAADEAEVAGHPGLATGIRGMVEDGLEVTALRWWRAKGEAPPGIPEGVWKNLPLEDRLAILGMLDEKQSQLPSDPLKSTQAMDAGAQAALDVFLFVSGKSEVLPPLSTWEAAATAAGMNLMDYVMKMLGITEYERDMTAGVGLVETRSAGPVAMLLCEQAYWNRVMDSASDNWGSVETAWKGFAQIQSGYDLDGQQGRDYAGYLKDALAGGTAQGDDIVFSREWSGLPEKDIPENTLQKAAEAARDQAWRLIAGYKLAKEYGQDVTFFLNDEESTWWKYHDDAMKAGLVVYESNEQRWERYVKQTQDYVQDHNPQLAGDERAIAEKAKDILDDRHLVEYPDPKTLKGSMEMVKTSYEYGNQYESNPSYADHHEFMLEPNHEYYKDVPEAEGKNLLIPRYAHDVYQSARGLQSLTGHGIPDLRKASAYVNHHRSLILFANEYTHESFASYYFPPEDPANLPNYGTPIE